MNPVEEYIKERDKRVLGELTDWDLQTAVSNFTGHLVPHQFVKNFTWMGVPILQYPTDLMVIQEILFKVKPDFVIECGVAFGGLTCFIATCMDRINCEARLFAIDIDMREYTKRTLDKIIFPFVRPVQASSTSMAAINAVKKELDPFIDAYKTEPEIYEPPAVMVILDSNHTHDHVLKELQLYSPLVSVGSYIIVMDTAIEFYHHLDKNKNRPWGKGNNPWTAVQSFMKDNDQFVVDYEVETRALITSAPGGWLRRIK